jgi:hypothetical protein
VSVKRIHRIVTSGVVNVGGTGSTPFQAPRSFIDFSEAEIGVEWLLDVQGITGTADSWYLTTKTQFGHPDVGRAQYGFGAFRWYDLTPEQIAAFHAEGTAWKGGSGATAGPITNLHPNPSAELSTNWIADGGGSGGAATASRPTDGTAFNRGSYYRSTFTTQPSASTGGIKSSPADVTAGSTYSTGMYVRPSTTMLLRTGTEWLNSSSGTISTAFGASISCPAGVWTRITAPGLVAPSGAVSGRARVIAGAGAQYAVGDTVDADAVMFNAGPSLYDYFDGSTNGGAWTGTPDASTSTKTVVIDDGTVAVARSTDAMPVTVSRLVKGSRMLERLWIQPFAVNPSSDFGVRYSLAAVVG